MVVLYLGTQGSIYILGRFFFRRCNPRKRLLASIQTCRLVTEFTYITSTVEQMVSIAANMRPHGDGPSNVDSSAIGHSTAYDVVCIGFGTKGLAFTTVLADHDPSQRVLVVERDSRFNDDLGFAAEDGSAGSTFLRDLITLRNPRSEFTFVNFLHETNLLVAFTNASQLTTSRRLTARYMAWVAQKIEQLGWVSFNKEAVNIKPTSVAANGQVTRWTIDLRASGNGAASKVSCKRLIVATGPQSRLPKSLASPKLSSNVLPLSKSAELLQMIHNADRPLSIAIIGADQEAVELFEHLISAPGQHRATMVLAGSALRVEDCTPL